MFPQALKKMVNTSALFFSEICDTFSRNPAERKTCPMPEQRKRRRKRRRSSSGSSQSGAEKYRDKLQRKAPPLKGPLIALAIFLVAAMGFAVYYDATKMQPEPASTVVHGEEDDPLKEILGGRATYSSPKDEPMDREEAAVRGAVEEDINRAMMRRQFQGQRNGDNAQRGSLSGSSLRLHRENLAEPPKVFEVNPEEVFPENTPNLPQDDTNSIIQSSPGVEYSNMHVLDPVPHVDDDMSSEPREGSAADALRMPQVGDPLVLPNQRDWKAQGE